MDSSVVGVISSHGHLPESQVGSPALVRAHDAGGNQSVSVALCVGACLPPHSSGRDAESRRVRAEPETSQTCLLGEVSTFPAPGASLCGQSGTCSGQSGTSTGGGSSVPVSLPLAASRRGPLLCAASHPGPSAASIQGSPPRRRRRNTQSLAACSRGRGQGAGGRERALPRGPRTGRLARALGLTSPFKLLMEVNTASREGSTERFSLFSAASLGQNGSVSKVILKEQESRSPQTPASEYFSNSAPKKHKT